MSGCTLTTLLSTPLPPSAAEALTLPYATPEAAARALGRVLPLASRGGWIYYSPPGIAAERLAHGWAAFAALLAEAGALAQGEQGWRLLLPLNPGPKAPAPGEEPPESPPAAPAAAADPDVEEAARQFAGITAHRSGQVASASPADAEPAGQVAFLEPVPPISPRGPVVEALAQRPDAPTVAQMCCSDAGPKPALSSFSAAEPEPGTPIPIDEMPTRPNEAASATDAQAEDAPLLGERPPLPPPLRTPLRRTPLHRGKKSRDPARAERLAERERLDRAARLARLPAAPVPPHLMEPLPPIATSDRPFTPVPKFETLGGTDEVLYRRRRGGKQYPGSVVAQGDDVTGEVTTDHVPIRDAKSFRLYMVERKLIEVPFGRRLENLRAQLRAAPRLRAAALAAGPAGADRTVDRGPASLHEVPKEALPTRSIGFTEHVQGQDCIGCGRQGPNEAHHTYLLGHPLSVKEDDLGQVPVCHACHLCVTDTDCLPGCTLEETWERFSIAQILILRDFVRILFGWIVPDSLRVATYAERQLFDFLSDAERLGGEVIYAAA